MATVSKTEAKRQVVAFARSNGISVNGKGGIPLLAKGDWFYCADDWINAYEYLAKARLAHIDRGSALPWSK